MDLGLRLEATERENDRLRERVDFLERALFASDVILPVEWRLTSSERRVFGVLLSREVATKSAVMTALYSDRCDEEPGIKIIDVFVCNLRKKVAPFDVKIVTEWGTGWRLDAATRAKFRGGA